MTTYSTATRILARSLALVGLAIPFQSTVACSDDPAAPPDSHPDAGTDARPGETDAGTDSGKEADPDGGNDAGQCSAAWVDCDGNASNGCETHVQNDAKSCGVCGHACLGGQCVNAACQPLKIGTAPLSPNTAFTALAIDGGSVYYAYLRTELAGRESYMLSKVSKSGTNPVSIDAEARVGTIGFDRSHAYYTMLDAGSGALRRVDKELANRVDVVSPTGTQKMFGLIVDTRTVGKTILEYTDTASQAIWQSVMPPPSSTQSERKYVSNATSVQIQKIIGGVGNETWLESGPRSAILQRDTSPPFPNNFVGKELVARTETSIGDIVYDGPTLYWSENNGIWRLDASGNPTKIRAATGAPQLAIDTTHIYWTEGTHVMRAMKSGAEPTVMATSQRPFYLVNDAQALYFTDDLTQGVYMLAK